MSRTDPEPVRDINSLRLLHLTVLRSVISSRLDLCESAFVFRFPFGVLKSPARRRAAAPDSASLPLKVQPSTCLVAGIPKKTNLLKSDTTPSELVNDTFRVVLHADSRRHRSSDWVQHISQGTVSASTHTSSKIMRLPPLRLSPTTNAQHFRHARGEQREKLNKIKVTDWSLVSP